MTFDNFMWIRQVSDGSVMLTHVCELVTLQIVQEH
jgi:hypothetical protein